MSDTVLDAIADILMLLLAIGFVFLMIHIYS